MSNCYHNESLKPLSKGSFKAFICCKTKYLRGATLSEFAPFGSKKPTQMCCQHICVDNKKHNYERSIEIYRPTEYNYTANWYSKTRNAPPQPVSANVKKNHNLHNLQNLRSPLNPCNLRLGDSVRINSPRESRQKYNGMIGLVCAVVWPLDINRTVIYVKVNGLQPCFFNSELRFIAPELLEQGVQPCQ